MEAPELFIKTCTTGALILVGKTSELVDTVHVPPIVIECFQIGSYSAAMIVAAITVYKFFKVK